MIYSRNRPHFVHFQTPAAPEKYGESASSKLSLPNQHNYEERRLRVEAIAFLTSPFVFPNFNTELRTSPHSLHNEQLHSFLSLLVLHWTIDAKCCGQDFHCSTHF